MKEKKQPIGTTTNNYISPHTRLWTLDNGPWTPKHPQPPSRCVKVCQRSGLSPSFTKLLRSLCFLLLNFSFRRFLPVFAGFCRQYFFVKRRSAKEVVIMEN